MLVPFLDTREGCGMEDKFLHAFPGAGCENCHMLSRVRLSLVPDHTRIQNVGQ